MANPWVKQWEVTGTSGKTYKVSQRQDGTFGCDCPAHKFQKSPKKDCQHILAKRLDLLTKKEVAKSFAETLMETKKIKVSPSYPVFVLPDPAWHVYVSETLTAKRKAPPKVKPEPTGRKFKDI